MNRPAPRFEGRQQVRPVARPTADHSSIVLGPSLELAARALGPQDRPAGLAGVGDYIRCAAVAAGREAVPDGYELVGPVDEVLAPPQLRLPLLSKESAVPMPSRLPASSPTAEDAGPVGCPHLPPCPAADSTDRGAARTVAFRPEQGWSLLCNGVLLFEDQGEVLPDGGSVAPRRAAFARCGPFGPLRVSVLPAAMAYDYEWVAGRLLDPVVLGGAVALALFRAPLLAVPAGGCRLGGYVDAVDERTAHEVVAVLGGRPGFSGLRLRTVSGPVAKVLVEWGERVPEGLDARARARFYGFRAPAAGAGVAPGGGHLGSGPSRAVRDRLAGVGRRRGSPVRFRRRPLPGSSTGAVRDEGPERRPEAAASGAAPAR